MRNDESMMKGFLQYPQMTRIAIFGNCSYSEIFLKWDLSTISNVSPVFNLLGDFI
jgi:hypothetical protein